MRLNKAPGWTRGLDKTKPMRGKFHHDQIYYIKYKNQANSNKYIDFRCELMGLDD